MALSQSQRVNCRRWAGYGLVGDTSTAIFSQPVYAPAYNRTGVGIMLDARLDHLTESEEDVLVNTYLITLAKLETDILKAGESIDTDTAGPWIRNKRERQERKALFNEWRRAMCHFLNFAPGGSLGDGSISLLRA